MSESKYYSEATQPCPGKGFQWDAESWQDLVNIIACFEGRGGQLTIRWDSDEKKEDAES